MEQAIYWVGIVVGILISHIVWAVLIALYVRNVGAFTIGPPTPRVNDDTRRSA